MPSSSGSLRGRVDLDHALALEEVGDRVALAEVAAILDEDVPQRGAGPVPVVGDAVDQDRHAGGPVTLVAELLESLTGSGAGAPIDGVLDLVRGHVRLARLLDREAQPEVAVRVPAAFLGGDRHLAGDLGEGDGSLGVDDRLLVLDAGPLRMAGH